MRCFVILIFKNLSIFIIFIHITFSYSSFVFVVYELISIAQIEGMTRIKGVVFPEVGEEINISQINF